MNFKAIAFLVGFPVVFVLIILGLAYFQQGGLNLPFAGSAQISFEQARQLAINQIPKDANLTDSGMWYWHVSSNGIIHLAGQTDHDIVWSDKINCVFPIKPSDGKDHFVYVVRFVNEHVAFVIILDDQKGQILDKKILPSDSAFCE